MSQEMNVIQAEKKGKEDYSSIWRNEKDIKFRKRAPQSFKKEKEQLATPSQICFLGLVDEVNVFDISDAPECWTRELFRLEPGCCNDLY